VDLETSRSRMYALCAPAVLASNALHTRYVSPASSLVIPSNQKAYTSISSCFTNDKTVIKQSHLRLPASSCGLLHQFARSETYILLLSCQSRFLPESPNKENCTSAMSGAKKTLKQFYVRNAWFLLYWDDGLISSIGAV